MSAKQLSRILNVKNSPLVLYLQHYVFKTELTSVLIILLESTKILQKGLRREKGSWKRGDLFLIFLVGISKLV